MCYALQPKRFIRSVAAELTQASGGLTGWVARLLASGAVSAPIDRNNGAQWLSGSRSGSGGEQVLIEVMAEEEEEEGRLQ